MKYSSLFLVLILLGCSIANEKEYLAYGAKVSPGQTVDVSSFLEDVETTSKSFKVSGTIEEVCQMKGCWMTLKNESGSTIRVTFKDYGFFVPKDISGKSVIIEGEGVKEVLDEDVAKHYADDSGKEYHESMRNTISFVAHGVLVEKGQS